MANSLRFDSQGDVRFGVYLTAKEMELIVAALRKTPTDAHVQALVTRVQRELERASEAWSDL